MAATVGLSDAVALKRQLKQKDDELVATALRLKQEEERATQLASENERLRQELAASTTNNNNNGQIPTTSRAVNAELVELRGQLAVRDERIKALQYKLELAENERRNAEAGMQQALRDAAAAAEKLSAAPPVDKTLQAANEKLRVQLVTERFKEMGYVTATYAAPHACVSSICIETYYQILTSD